MELIKKYFKSFIKKMSLSYGPQASNEDGLINESVDLEQVDRRDVILVFLVEPHQHSFLKTVSI